MNEKIVRPLVLILVLLGITLFAFKRGYLLSSHEDTPTVKLPQEKLKTLDKNRLEALSEVSISSLRKKFLDLKKIDTHWPSLPESANDSLWIKGQQRRLSSVLKDVEFDTIVLPIQQSRITYDKTARMMAARFVANDIRSNTKNRVMPVDFVYQLLGDNRSHFSDEDIKNLQHRYKVKQIVYLFLREDYRDKNKLFLVAALNSNNKVQKTHYLHIDKPNDENSLSSIITGDLLNVTEALYELPKKIKLEKSEVAGNFTFPDSLDTLTKETSAIQTAIYFQLLGMAISEEQRLQERTRYFERSLLALRSVSESVPEFRILKARALFYLFRRPEAVKLLSSPASNKEKAFMSFMNGNFYELESEYKELEPGLFQAFSYIELKLLADAYKISNDEYSMADYGNSWSALLEQAANDNDDWGYHNNDHFFDSLEGLFPDFDAAYAKLLTGKTLENQINREFNSGNLLFESTATQLLQTEKKFNCCNQREGQITKVDILEFYRTLGLVNILRSLDKKINLQSVNTPTTELFEEPSSILDGDIRFLSLKVDSLESEIKRVSKSNHPKLLKELIDNINLIFSSTSNSDSLHYWASRVFYDNLKNYKLYFDYEGISRVAYDFGDWPTNIRRISSHRERESYYYEYSHDSIFNIKTALKRAKSTSEKEFLFKEFEKRYNGHPDKVVYLAKFLEEKGDTQGAISRLERSIENGDVSWETYSSLGEKYVERGDYEKAAKTYLKYPSFSGNSTANRVRLSNRAADAGDKLYWKGKYQLAKPFYEVAANLRTGSASSITSALRLAYIESDYALAASHARLAATRYSSHYRYRDFLSLMHLFGLSDGADALFFELAPRSKKPDIWPSIQVGYRKKSTPINDLINELSAYSGVNFSQLHLVKQSVVKFLLTDRRMNIKEVDEVSKLLSSDPSPLNYRNISYASLAGHLNPKITEGLKESPLKGVTLTKFNSENCSAEEYVFCGAIDYKQILSSHELFLRAYHELEKGNYEYALNKFIEYDLYYPLNEFSSNLRYSKPTTEIFIYVAMAAAQSGKSQKMSGYLDAYSSSQFDYWLAKAITASDEDQTSESIEYLKEAFRFIPFADHRTIHPWYQLAEVCEWLFNESGDQQFVDMALSWMQDYQVINPIYSWTYAFEAKYSKDKDRKIRAIGIANYLDPNSQWLSEVSNELKLQGRDWMKKNNPFIIKQPVEQESI